MFYAHQGVKVSAEKDEALSGTALHQTMLAFHHLEGVLGIAFTMFPGSTWADNPQNAYNNVTYSIHHFLKNLRIAKVACEFLRGGHRPKFLDCGCGLGTKSFLARHNGFDAYGIDLNPVYVEIARAVIDGAKPEYKDSAVVANMLEYEGYGDFDCIYFYCPIRHQEKMMRFEKRVISQLQKPTIIFGVFPCYCGRSDAENVHTIMYPQTNLFLANGTKEQRDDLEKYLADNKEDWE